MGLVTLIFDRLTLKLVCESHLKWGIFRRNLSTLGHCVLDYSLCTRPTDKRTDGRTKATLIAPFPVGAGHNYAAKCRYVTIKTEKVRIRGLMTLQFVDCSSDKSISNCLMPVHCHLSSFHQSITGISPALDESVLADGRLSRASCGTALTAVGCGRLL